MTADEVVAVRALTAIHDMCPQWTFEEIVRRVASWQLAWSLHPDYQPRPGCYLMSLQVVGVFRHPPGHGRLEESYAVGALPDVIATINKPAKQRMLGTFVELRCILPELPAASERILFVVNSLLGAGMGYHCRMELKRLLPRRLHPLITKLRKHMRAPKHVFAGLDPNVKFEDMSAAERTAWRKTPALQPEWYRGKTKFELICEHVFTPAERRDLLIYFRDLETFRRCAMGELEHYEDVQKYVVHQAPLMPEVQT